MTTPQRFRIYALTSPHDDLSPRYVGQTTATLSERLADHLRIRGTSKRADWLRSLRAGNLRPGIVQLEEIRGTRRDAYAAEQRWIKRLSDEGHRLLNHPAPEPVSPADCEHESWTGVDGTPLDDPAKLWRCDVCGLETTETSETAHA